MIAKLLLQTLLYIAGMAALLLVSAGTWHWPAAWVFLAAMAVLGLGSGVWLARTDPALLVASTAYIMWVMRKNSFAAPVVKVQAERGHRVIDSGPYAHVRHPMYSGTVLFFVGVPLLVGSWWGVVLAPLFAGLFAVRAGIEERALLSGLPGYAEYTAKVRYRLLPGIW